MLASARAIALWSSVSVCAPLLGAQEQEGVPISGVVLDADGEPAPRARLGTGWWFDASRLSCYGTQWIWRDGAAPKQSWWEFLETDAEGRFAARIRPVRGQIALTVFSADGAQAVHQLWREGADLRELSLQMLPVANVHVDLSCPELGREKTPAIAYLNAVPSGTRLGRFKCDAGSADLVLPPGTYELYVYGTDMDKLRQRVTVTAGQELNQRLEIPASFFALQRGKPMPEWTVTEARGLDGAEPTLASFAGKWLMVEFWTYWCGPCVGRGIPELIEFDRAWREKNPDREPPYAIVLLHARDAADLAALDAEIEKRDLRAKYWGGKPLPFPVLVDAEGKTKDAWRVRAYPTTILIDPQGVLVGEGDADLLERALAGQVATPAPRHVPAAAERQAAAEDAAWQALPVRDRRRSLLAVASLFSRDTSESWCRSLLWNPRQIYVAPETRKELAGQIDESVAGIKAESERIQKLRLEEFNEAIAEGKLAPLTSDDLTEKERERMAAMKKQMPDMNDQNLLQNVLMNTRKLRMMRSGGGALYGAALEDLPRTWALEQELRSQKLEAFEVIGAAFVDEELLTEGEVRAMRAELEQLMNR